MATQKTHPLKKVLSATLTFVRGPIFLSMLSVVLLAVAIPAQATLLRGYLQQSVADAAKGGGEDMQANSIVMDAIGAEASGSKYISPDEEHAASGTAQQGQEAPVESGKLHRAMLADNSFPQTFAGMWKCVTVVVDSAVSSVPVGQRVESAVNFEQTNDGRVVARWEQPGWTEAQSSVVPMSQNEVALERTNYYRNGGSWAAHSRDRYLQLDANRIAADSQVEQFINGQFLGRYETKSMLYRMSGNIAMK
jgi:hypothetical protein